MQTKKFHLELGKPVAVAQGDVNLGWGPYQFPMLEETAAGHIYCKWAMGADLQEGGGLLEGAREAISEDGGRTWRRVEPTDKIISHDMMPNGKAFFGFYGKHAHPVDYDVSKYTPVCRGGQKSSIYFADDIKELDRSISAIECDPVTGERNVFPVQVNWPYMPVTFYDRPTGPIVYPPCQTFALCNRTGQLVLDDALYYCCYSAGFDSKTGEVGKYSCYYSVYVFRSVDSGRTWDYISQISTDDDTFVDTPYFEGPCEPRMDKMPDGSVVMLIRTSSTTHSLLARSTDHCRTWSKPVVFDDFGVFPQILPLKCGVTLATYGRPKMHVRATSDPAGLEWEEPLFMPTSYEESEFYSKKSCFYTSLFALDDCTALMAYSDFRYPNSKGEPKKSIMVRTVRVVIEE